MADPQTAANPEPKIPFCSVDAGEKDSVLDFNFGNGVKVSLDLDDLNEDITGQLLVHGITQKGRDSFASAKGDFGFAIAAVTKVFENLTNGQWNASRASGTDGKPRTTELAEAIANLKGIALATVQEAVENATDEQRKAWRKNAGVAAEVCRIRTKKAEERVAKAKADGTLELVGL